MKRLINYTKAGGYLVAGYTESKGAGGSDVWVIKLNRRGEIVWDKTFGGKSADYASSIIQTKAGEYLVAGKTRSKGAGDFDAWVIKLNRSGEIVWDKTFGGKELDHATSIISTKAGRYLLAGYTDSKGAGGKDAWVIKFTDSK